MTRFLGAERLGRGNHIKNKTEIVSLLRSPVAQLRSKLAYL